MKCFHIDLMIDLTVLSASIALELSTGLSLWSDWLMKSVLLIALFTALYRIPGNRTSTAAILTKVFSILAVIVLSPGVSHAFSLADFWAWYLGFKYLALALSTVGAGIFQFEWRKKDLSPRSAHPWSSNPKC